MSDSLLAQSSLRQIKEYVENLTTSLESLTEEQIWYNDEVVINSIGTLARHITGNLNHYLGAGILKNGYVREREKEFTERNIPQAQIIADLQAAVDVAGQALAAVDKVEARQPHRTPCGVDFDSLGYHIVRITTHLAHHCGQADYAERYVKTLEISSN